MPPPTFKQQVKEHFLFYRNLLGLPKSWRFRLVINDKIKEYANIEVDMEKKAYVINVNPKRNKNEKELRDTILHELLHALFSPGSDKINTLCEKIKNKEEIDYKKVEKELDRWEEKLVLKLTHVILQIKEEGTHD